MLSGKRMFGMFYRQCVGRLLSVLPLASIVFANGCAIAPAPLHDTPEVVTSPEQGKLSIAMEPANAVGEVQPVYLSIANGTDEPRSVVPSEVFAIDMDGQRTATLPPGEAAREAGGAGELKAALASGVASGALGGVFGATLGAAVGTAFNNTARGAELGGATAAGRGAFRGSVAGANKADRQAREQISALALRRGEVRNNFTLRGYVFFPRGDYKEIQVLLVNNESGDTEVIERPWK